MKSIPSMSLKTKAMKSLGRKILCVLLSGVFFGDTIAWAEAPILPDTTAPGNRYPLVQETANGIPLVNISAPTAGGVSRNDYERFNIPTKGVILNNSYTLSKTELAGYVQGNANMAQGPAKIILNQVTSGNPTTMNGFLEVAGHKADVIIANPNGITVNGGGFINTARAILTTGKPEYDSKERLKDFRIDNDATILITGNGLNGKKADTLELYTRAAEIEAAIFGNTVHVTTGANVIDANTGKVTAIEGKGKEPEIAIDVKDLGGMYAGRIFLIGNEKGLPIDIKGAIESQHMVLDNQGNLYHAGTTHSTEDMTIHAKTIQNTGTMASSGHMSLQADGQITNDKTIGSVGNMAITANQVTNHKTIASEKDLSITTTSEEENALDNSNSEILANGNVTIQASHTDNMNGNIASGSTLSIQGKTLNNAQGKLTAYGSNTISVSDKLENEQGLIAANENISISSDLIHNAQGTITAGQNETITTKDIQLDGKLAAGNNLTITTDHDITNDSAKENYGITQADGNLTISAKGNLTNSKKLESKGTLTLSAKDISNKESGEINGGSVSITSTTLTNRGLVSADQANTITTDILQNIATGRIYGEDITLHAKTLENRKDKVLEEKLAAAMKDLKQKEQDLDDAFAIDVTAFKSNSEKENYFKEIENKQAAYAASKAAVDAILEDMAQVKSATIAARNDMIITGDTLLNSASSLLYAGGDMAISEAKDITNQGADIKAQGNMSLTAPTITNANEAFSAKRVWTSEVTNPDLIRIDEKEHPERGQSFTRDEFSALDSGYGAYHNKGITPKTLYEEAGYDKIEQITEEERKDGEKPVPDDLVGKEAPNYDYNDPIFKELGVKSMDTPRPGYDDPKQADWDKQYKEILNQLNEKIKAYNEEAKAYNDSIGAIESKAIKYYTIIRTITHTSEKQVQETKAGNISSGKDMILSGNVTNENSRITAGSTLTEDGSLISANTLLTDTKGTLTNQGTLKGNTIITKSKNIVNKGTIFGNDISLKASQDIVHSGIIEGENKILLDAGRNILMKDTVQHGKNQDILDTTAGIAVKGKEGVLLMQAGQDITMTGATLAALGENGSMILSAGHNLTMDTDSLEAKKDMTENSDNYIRTYRKTETANTLAAGKTITLAAGENLSARNTTVLSENGQITVAAKSDVNLENGYNESRDDYGLKYKERGLLSSKTTTIKSHDESKTVTASTLSGDAVQITAVGNTNVTGSNVVGTHDVAISSGKDTSISSAEEYERHDYAKQVKKSGLLSGGGLGFTIGTEKRKDQYSDADLLQKASTVGSASGNVSIESGNKVEIGASAVLAGKDISITGENVQISSKDNVYHSEEKHEYKKSGLTVSVGGAGIEAIESVAAPATRMTEVSDHRLKALYGYETAEKIKKNGDALKAAAKGNFSPTVSIGITSSSSKSESHSTITEAQGSSLQAGQDMTIKTKEDLNVKGSDIVGNHIHLEADNDIHIWATEEKETQKSSQSSKGGSLGVSLSAGSVVSVDGKFYAGKGKENGSTTSYRASTVNANDTLTMKSGKDTDLIGSTVSGNKVKADVDGNLNIESLQTKKEYSEENISAGMSFSTAAGKTSYGGSASKGNMKSHYESVINQAGIRAGGEGFDISVKENTDLKGGVIDSAASKDKNTLTTGTLRWEDKENKADYKAGGMGVSYLPNNKSSKLNQRGLTPNLTPTVKDNADSTTKSAVAEGTIHITNKEKQKQDIASLNRDTKNSLNQLQEIFDKSKVEEKQELVGMLEKYGNQAIHTYAESKGWKDGSTEKMLLHGAFGALMGDMAGGSAATGALSGGVNEYVMGYLTKTKGKDWVQEHPDTVQWISAGVGAAIGASAKDMATGANVALDASKWNYLGFGMDTSHLLRRTLKNKDGRELSEKEWNKLSDKLYDIAYTADPFGSESEQLEIENETVKKNIRNYLVEEGFTIDSTEEFMNSYDQWVRNLQNDMKHTDILHLKPVRVTADAIKDASDSKGVKFAIGSTGYIVDGLDILQSSHSGESAYTWVVGTETGYVIGETLLFTGIYLGLPYRFTLIGSGVLGGTAGNVIQDKLEQAFHEWHAKNEQEKSDISK